MTKISKMLATIVCSMLLLSCKKEQLACFTPPQQIMIRLLDKDGSDLLDPTNLNGYKSTDINLFYLKDDKKNYSSVKLDSRPDTKAYFLTTDISWNADKGKDFSLVLSPTVTDKIYLRYDKKSEDHCGFYKFVEFKYNNISYNQTTSIDNLTSFVITK